MHLAIVQEILINLNPIIPKIAPVDNEYIVCYIREIIIIIGVKMKKLILGMLLFAVAGTASAAWCRAESFSAWGYGTAPSIAEACNIALYQCASRTPWNQTCVVVGSGY